MGEKMVIQSGRPIGLPRRLYCVQTKLERKLWSGFYTSNEKCKLAKFTSSQGEPVTAGLVSRSLGVLQQKLNSKSFKPKVC
jgi:hypothetical protein